MKKSEPQGPILYAEDYYFLVPDLTNQACFALTRWIPAVCTVVFQTSDPILVVHMLILYWVFASR